MVNVEQADLKDICPLIKKEISNGTFKEWYEEVTLINDFPMSVYRNNIQIYRCDPGCAIKNMCRTENRLCPFPHNKCDLLCAYTHRCEV